MNNNTYLRKTIYALFVGLVLSAASYKAQAEKTPKLNASISNECVPRKGFYGDPGSATAGAIIKVYAYDGAQLTANAGSIFNAGTITANSDGSWVWKCNGSNSCTAGANNCITNGTYAVTQTAPGKTESDPIFICVGASNQSSKPVINGTNFSTSGTVSGNAGNNAGVTVYTRIGSVYNKIGFTNANSTGQWTISGLTITPCDTLTALSVEPTMCLSAYADAKTEGGIQQVTLTSDRGLTACAGDTIRLTASQASNITWSTGETSQTINALTSGSYTVTYSLGAGCSNNASANLTFNSLPPTPVVYSISGNQGCLGDTMTLYTNAMPGMSYSWRRYGINMTGATAPTVLINSPARYYVTYTDANGCRAESDTFHVYGGPTTPAISVTGSTVLCNSSTAVINTPTVSGLTYQWRTYGNAIVGATTNNFTARTAGRYTVTVSNAHGCSNTSSAVDVTVTPQMPVITASGSLAVCQGGGVKINSSIINDVTYQWKKYGRNIPGATATALFTSGEGFFKVTVTDANGCSRTSDSVQVYFTPAKPVITATGPTSFCPGDSVVLQATAIANVNYVWKRWTTNVPSSNQNTLTAKNAGRYRVQVTDMKGCTRTSDPIDVVTACRLEDSNQPLEAELNIYPNPSNGAFEISFEGATNEDLNIEIFNSIGAPVKFMREQTSWGTVKVEGLIPGVYFAKVHNGRATKVMRIIRE
ncbi:MAG: T9SS type A sorting domain-containing protein [Bacteroidota bacterium]|jgi:hypothetical protein